MSTSIAVLKRLTSAGVAGITIAWADNSGIPRSRTVPLAALVDTAERGAGITPLFAVFDSHDGITFAPTPWAIRRSAPSPPSAARTPVGSGALPGGNGRLAPLAVLRRY